jgi:hypothetical protein
VRWMPESFEALAVIAIALLPGALYVWSFERLAGSSGGLLREARHRGLPGSGS